MDCQQLKVVDVERLLRRNQRLLTWGILFVQESDCGAPWASLCRQDRQKATARFQCTEVPDDAVGVVIPRRDKLFTAFSRESQSRSGSHTWMSHCAQTCCLHGRNTVEILF